MIRTGAAEKDLDLILSDADLSASAHEKLRSVFFLLHALDFAKYLHRTDDLSDQIKGRLLALRVRIPQDPADKESVVQSAMDDAVQNMWSRIAAIQER
jgi:hypothetical protein